MKIQDGWRFCSADFSCQADGKFGARGQVMLVREPIAKARWHRMSVNDKEDDNGPPLYVFGYGVTLDEAIAAANQVAADAKMIPDEDEDSRT